MIEGIAKAQPARLPLLDGMRGLAAIYVMTYHAYLFGLAGPLMQRAYLFVDLFFVLSGFVLAKAFDHRLREGMSVRAFMRLRVVRLWPMVIAGTLTGALLYVSAGRTDEALRWLPLSLFLIPALWLPATLFPLNGPQWSLVLELLANLVHALVLVRLRTAWLAGAVAVAGIALAWCIVRNGSNELGMVGANFVPGMARVMFGYGAGLLIARVDLHALAIRLPSLAWPLTLALPVAFVAALPALPFGEAAGDIAFVALLPAWLAIAISSRTTPGIDPWLRRLGLLSYPLYAVHEPVLRMAQVHLSPETGQLVAPLAAIALAAALAAAFEARRTRLGRRKTLTEREALEPC